MFGMIRSEFLCLEGLGQNSNAWKDKKRIAVFERIRPEFDCLKG